MRDALNKTGRPIFFSVCGGGDHGAGENISYYATDPRGGAKLANAWRISGDVIIWSTFPLAIDANNGLEKVAGPGGFNDPDMLLGSSQSFVMTPEQSRTQFNLLAVLMAPLLIGADVRNLPRYDFTTYTNTEVIAVNQDSLMKQGRRLANTTFSAPGKYPVLSVAIWARELSQGGSAIVFVNNNNSTTKITCDSQCWAKLPYKTGLRFQVRDLWTHGPATKAEAVAGEDYEVSIEDGGGVSKMLVFKPRASVALVV
jgi:alpha-galactosidase